MAPKSRPPAAQEAADRVAGIISAAEQLAEQVRHEADERVRERLAEGDRAAQYRIRAAEEEANEILAEARQEAGRLMTEAEELNTEAASKALTVVADAENTAERIIAEARQAATQTRRDADDRSRTLLQDARETSDGVRAEGLELVANLREMGHSLRTNAELLLGDVQRVHARMMRDLDEVTGDMGAEVEDRPGRAAGRARSGRSGLTEPPDGEVLDVPEFMP